MIGSSSARVRERLADGDVIVVEVIGVLLLAGGFLGVFEIRLRDEVVVGLTTCGRLVLGQGPQRSCTGDLFTTSWKMKLTGRRKNRGDRREGDEEEEVNGDVESIRETHRNEMTMHG